MNNIKKITNKLTSKQQRFVEKYIIDFNATQAVIRAGYSENTAYSTVSGFKESINILDIYVWHA